MEKINYHALTAVLQDCRFGETATAPGILLKILRVIGKNQRENCLD